MARKPCKECPFARATEPGETGGTGPTTYVAQAHGPFLLSCHMDPDYEKDRRSTKLLQCAGAAIYRANTKRAELMPPALLTLEPDTELVFGGPAELLAHHGEVPVFVAEQFLREHPVDELLAHEVRRSGVQVVAMDREKP